MLHQQPLSKASARDQPAAHPALTPPRSCDACRNYPAGVCKAWMFVSDVQACWLKKTGA